MSDCWTEDEYKEILSFVENYLWLFVQENATIHKPEQIVCNLAQIDRRELRILQLIYFLLSSSIQKSIKECTPQLIRHMAQSTDKMTVELKGLVRGNVDWNLTLKQRLGKGFINPTVFVTRLPIKTHNLPEVQALKYLLTQTNLFCREVLGNIPDTGKAISYEANKKWKEEVRSLYHLTNTFLKNTCFRDVVLPTKITNMMLQKVRCARNYHFKSIFNSLQLYHRLFIQEEKESLQECFAQGVLKPLSRDTLYEVYILFITIASFEQVGWERENLKLIGYGKGAVAQYQYGNETVRVYYQTLPAIFDRNSLYTEIMRKYKIDARLRRPDIILEFNADECSFHLLEVKRTQNKSYILDSVYKVLGYLKDFENCFRSGEKPNAILVVWAGVERVENEGDLIVVINQRDYQHFLEASIVK